MQHWTVQKKAALSDICYVIIEHSQIVFDMTPYINLK